MRRRKRIVCIGGGTGQSQILRGLSLLPFDITALVGVTDNGGHSGILRNTFGIPQVGDIRNCMASLADEKSVLGTASTTPLCSWCCRVKSSNSSWPAHPSPPASSSARAKLRVRGF